MFAKFCQSLAFTGCLVTFQTAQTRRYFFGPVSQAQASLNHNLSGSLPTSASSFSRLVTEVLTNLPSTSLPVVQRSDMSMLPRMCVPAAANHP
jgi:hypothetical protein